MTYSLIFYYVILGAKKGYMHYICKIWCIIPEWTTLSLPFNLKIEYNQCCWSYLCSFRILPFLFWASTSLFQPDKLYLEIYVYLSFACICISNKFNICMYPYSILFSFPCLWALLKIILNVVLYGLPFFHSRLCF